MSVSLAATEIANDATKLEGSNLLALLDPLIEDWDDTEIWVSEGANSGIKIVRV